MSSKKKIIANVIIISVIISIVIIAPIIVTAVTYSEDRNRQLEFAQIETQIQEDSTSATVIESQSEEIKTTVNTMPLENIPKRGEAASVQTGFVTQDGERYYYDEQGNKVTGWFEAKDGIYLGEIPELESDEDIIQEEGAEQDRYQVIRKAYNADGSFIDSYTHSYDYDGQGRLREEIYYYSGGGIFRSTVYNYDGQGRPSKMEYSGGGLFYEEVCIYDEQGRLCKVAGYDGMDNTLDYYCIYSYDTQGRFCKTYYGEMNEEWSYYYDSQGRLCKIEMDKEYALVYSYDEQGRFRKGEFYDPDGSLSQYCVYSYDEQGGLCKSEIYDWKGSLKYHYIYSYDGQSKFIIPDELIYFEFGWVEISEIYMLRSNELQG